MDRINQNDKRFSEDETFRAVGGLLRLLREGEDSEDEARFILGGIIATLPKKKGEYFYPWYCLLAALAADLQHFRRKEEWFVRWNRRPSFLDDAYDSANSTWDKFWRQQPLTPLSDQVVTFLEEAKSVFVADCWHVIDSKEYDRANTEKLWTLLNAVSKNDVYYTACESVYHELHSLLAAGLDNMIAPLSMISAIELGGGAAV